jgi:hypothetical protein
MVFYVTPGVNADHVQVKGDRVCLVRGALPATPLNAPPIGDNHNIAPFVKDYASFPKLFRGEAESDNLIVPTAAPVEVENTD